MVTPSGGTAAERETLEDWQARAERSCGWGTTSSTEVPLPGGEQRRLLFPFCFGFNGGRRAAPREPEKKRSTQNWRRGVEGAGRALHGSLSLAQIRGALPACSAQSVSGTPPT